MGYEEPEDLEDDFESDEEEDEGISNLSKDRVKRTHKGCCNGYFG